MQNHDNLSFRDHIYEIIFEADTPFGKAFDVSLLVLILASVMAVMLESIPSVSVHYGRELRVFEWVVTIAFTLEYLLRVYSVNAPRRYVFSFFGLIDLLSILPTYLSLIFVGTQYMLIIRVVRLLRVFRVFKIARYIRESSVLLRAMMASLPKIVVFIFSVVSLVMIVGSMMYLIEGEESGFTSIPVSVYWAIVTLTTVGYGDLTPQTAMGKVLASAVMIMGYGIIAVPTGIVTSELHQMSQKGVTNRTCRDCIREGHAPDASHCKFCGAELP